MTITAPSAPGSYTYQVTYLSSLTPAGNNDSQAIQGNGKTSVFYKVTVANPSQNTTTKTSLSDIQGLTAQQLKSCSTDQTAVNDPVDFTTTDTTSLRYDATGKQWIQNWKTQKVTTDTCYRATVTFADGSSISAFFKLLR